MCLVQIFDDRHRLHENRAVIQFEGGDYSLRINAQILRSMLVAMALVQVERQMFTNKRL